MNIVPSSEVVLADLNKFTSLVWDVLERSAADARLMFRKRDRQFDSHHFASHVRWSAKAHFEANGVSVSDLQNNGILIEHGPYRVRIVKSRQGQLPPPGRSRARQDYYCQIAMTGDDFTFTTLNLILVWVLDQNNDIDELVMYCPRSGDDWSSDYYWRASVSHPLDTGHSFGLNVVQSEDEEEELSIEREDQVADSKADYD